jgi:hypothetical protein
MTLLEGGLYMGNILLHGNDDASRMGGLAKRRVYNGQYHLSRSRVSGLQSSCGAIAL